MIQVSVILDSFKVRMGFILFTPGVERVWKITLSVNSWTEGEGKMNWFVGKLKKYNRRKYFWTYERILVSNTSVEILRAFIPAMIYWLEHWTAKSNFLLNNFECFLAFLVPLLLKQKTLLGDFGEVSLIQSYLCFRSLWN